MKTQTPSIGRAMAANLEDGLNLALILMGAYVGLAAEQVGYVEVNKDLGVTPAAQNEIAALIQMRATKDISRETLYETVREYQARSRRFGGL